MPPPPSDEINRTHVDSRLGQLGRVQVTVVRTYRAIWTGLASVAIRHDPVHRQAHQLGERLADLVFGHAVLAAELEDRGELVLCKSVFGGVPLRHIDTDAADVLGVCGISNCPVVHLDAVGALFALTRPERVHQHIHRAFFVMSCRLDRPVQDWHPQHHRDCCLSPKSEDSFFSFQLGLTIDV